MQPQSSQPDKAILNFVVPNNFQFAYRGTYDFETPLGKFDWSIESRKVHFDFTACHRANYQALSLLVLYIWSLRRQGCDISFSFDKKNGGASTMWDRMGAQGLFHVLRSDDENFASNAFKPLFAIRNSGDFRTALEKAETYAQGFDVEYEKTLRYVISELLYNTLEHGHHNRIPSIIQFVWYREKEEIAFIIADLGIGIRKHLRQTYPLVEDHVSAIKLALEPEVSGTFHNRKPYQAENNAGVGLFISSNIIRRLNADMHVVSGNGVVHISPTDVTGRTIKAEWPGTFVYVTIKLGKSSGINLQKMMSEFRSAASQEISVASETENKDNLYVCIWNYFTRFAEDKMGAIRFRDTTLLPAIAAGKSLTLDFEEVVAAPHSFLNALLATPIRQYGMASYKKIKIINASPDIRETIDFILDKNTSINNE